MLIEFGYERRACYICNIKNRLDEYLTGVTDVNVFFNTDSLSYRFNR